MRMRRKLSFIAGSAFLGISLISALLFILAPYIFSILFGQSAETVCHDECAEQIEKCRQMETPDASCLTGCMINICTWIRNLLTIISISSFAIAAVAFSIYYFKDRG